MFMNWIILFSSIVVIYLSLLIYISFFNKKMIYKKIENFWNCLIEEDIGIYIITMFLVVIPFIPIWFPVYFISKLRDIIKRSSK